jgi:hypothetical protein|tara:strand:+ start:345 stop:545 length:201 start_codon:yes stop_codon:yes gene_type:complete
MNLRDELTSGHPDWWKVSVFHQKEYWEMLNRSVDQEREVCSPLEEIKDKLEICDVKLNDLIEGSHE